MTSLILCNPDECVTQQIFRLYEANAVLSAELFMSIQQINIMMIKVALSLLLFVLASSLSPYSYRFAATANNPYQNPSYNLGLLAQGTTLAISIQSVYINSISGAFSMAIMDSTNSITIDTLTVSVCSGNTCNLTYIVGNTDRYYLQVTSLNFNSESGRLFPFYLTVSANFNILFQLVDVFRTRVIKYFYVAQSSNVNFTITPGGDPSRFYFTLLSLDPTDPVRLRVLSSTTLTPTNTLNDIGRYSNYLLSGYYALIVNNDVTNSVLITYQSDLYMCPFSRFYQDYYNVFNGCTFSDIPQNNYIQPCQSYDYYNLVCTACFKDFALVRGTCVITTTCGDRQYSSNGVCINVNPTCGQFDITNGNCLNCVTPAYYLASTGQCLPINCIPNFYYSVKASACIPIPNLCFNFSTINQTCLTCVTGFLLMNGVCIQNSNALNCQVYDLALNLCSFCNQGYNLVNGGCSWNTVYCEKGRTLVNGVCILNPTIVCNSNQVFMNSQCVNLPPNCLSINTFYQCTACRGNSQMRSGVCTFCNGTNPNYPCVTCSSNQYVDSYGNCQDVSPNCFTFNSVNGQCVTCRFNGQLPVNGVCCASGESIQNGQCYNPSAVVGGSSSGDSYYSGFVGSLRAKHRNCKKINQEGVCIQCLDGYDFCI